VSWLRVHWRRIGGVALAAISLAAVTQSVRTSSAHHQYTRCQAEVIDQLIVALNARTAAATQDRDAMDQLVEGAATARSAADTRAALDRYRTTRATADAARNRKPLPEPPARRC
jgi:hypothetical protein